MIEEREDLWGAADLDEPDAIVITTNGYVKHTGECVMGRGIAKEAATRYPHLPLYLGQKIKRDGNHVHFINYKVEIPLVSFPVKHHWRDPADPSLIKRSAGELVELADRHEWEAVYLPRPGCGNGRLNWQYVKPLIEPLLDSRFIVFHYG